MRLLPALAAVAMLVSGAARAQGYLFPFPPSAGGGVSPTADLSSNIVRALNAPVARSQAARAADTYNVLDWGGDPSGVGDLGPVLNAIAGRIALSAGPANRIVIPAGSYSLRSAVVFNGVAPTIEGQGFTAGPGPTGSSGTWITISGTGYTPITFSGTNARGAVVRDVAFTEVQPAVGAGWAPTGYDFIFRVQNALGEVIFDHVQMSGVTLGIYADNSGRLNIRDLAGQFFTNAVTIDDSYDIPRIEHLHSWPYWSSASSVEAWQQANLNTVTLKRVDGIFIGDLFTFCALDALYLTTGTNGVTTKLYANSVYADQSKYGVLVDAAGANGQFGKVTTQHNDVVAGGGAIIAGSRGMLLTGNADQFQIGQWRTNSVGGPAIDLEGYNNRVTVGDLWANTYGVTPGDGTPAVMVADTGGNPANFAEVRGTPFLQGVSPLTLYNATTNGGRSRTMQVNSVDGGSPGNEVRAYDNSAGNPVSLAAIGSDASVDLQLQAKSTTGSVRLQSNGMTVLRTDAATGGGDDVLVRGNNGAVTFVPEGAEANVGFIVSTKGSSAQTIVQANGGNNVAKFDSPGPGNTDVLVRSGTGTINLLTESGSTNAELYAAGKGTGGVRLQSNGTTTLRTDNPNAVADDLLVRPGSGTLALTAEGSDPNINIVLNPQGAGTVVVGTVAGTDNSTNAASTAWVKGQGYAPAASPALTGSATVSLRSGATFNLLGTPPGGGTAKAGTYLLVASTTSTASTRLTTDGNAAGASNCINPAANTGMSLYVDITGVDATTYATAARYRLLDLLLLRGATAASTTLANGVSGVAPNGSVGTTTGTTFTAAADTTNGCLALSVTAPNADAWHWAAKVVTTEVQ